MEVVILAGGSGKRLWPLSKSNLPKQFLKLSQLGGKSLFQITFERAMNVVDDVDSIKVVVSDDRQRFLAMSELNELKINFKNRNLIVGPKKDTLSAVVFGLSYCRDYVLFLPSDHIIEKELRFFQALVKGKKLARSSLVLFGIKPTFSHTGYGYIKPKTLDINTVEKFFEKPNKADATKYVEEGYYWNSGIFLFRKSIFFDELKKVNPKVFNFFFNSSAKKIFEDAPEISVDRAVLEKSDNVKMVPLNTGWIDVGNFDSISLSNKPGKDSNQGGSNVEFFSSKNNLVLNNEKKLIVLSDVEDLVVINTSEAILVTRKGSTEGIRDVVRELEKKGK